MSPLCHLLQRPRDPVTEVARRWDPISRTDERVCWAEFQQDVAGLKDRIASESPGAWILLTEDAYVFAVGLFALWHAGRSSISPPNRQPSSLRSLSARSAGILTDQPAWFPGISSLHPLDDAEPGDPAALTVLDPGAPAMELFTSGTTGGEKPVRKQIRHLEDEVSELHGTWGGAVDDVTFFSSAWHQHLYGLLFGVLWPLYEGRPFQRHHILQPGELVPRMEAAGDCVLASVPTHLKRFARHTGTPSVRGTCRAVFSSGGPLAMETAYEVADAVAVAPIEVLGSTETGGIAWRTQQRDVPEPRWVPLSAVEVSCDDGEGLLRVRSPFVSMQAPGEAFVTGDRVSFHADGSFVLKGRADRVVKVGEKRLDLPRMESELRVHPLVDDVALTTLDRDGEVRVAAAVVPSAAGRLCIDGEGQRKFSQQLGAGLADAWDPVLHPRYWRVVAALPTNEMGKVTQDALRALFHSAPMGATRSDRPRVLEELRGVDLLEQSCRVPRDLQCFEGHFPGDPIVPGVLQLDWAMELASELTDASLCVEEIESVKFLAPLLPDAAFRISVRVVDGVQLEFQLLGEDVEYSRGRIRVGLRGGPRV